MEGGAGLALNMSLAIFGGFLGLVVTGIALYTAWIIHQLWKQQAASPRALNSTEIAARYLSHWTVMDFAIIGVSAIGLLLLAADLFADIRDRASFPPYHIFYLLCGLIFSMMGFLLLVVRLFVVIGINRPPAETSQSPISPNHHDQPNDTDHAK
jgi:predicted metal-binding membrane protein